MISPPGIRRSRSIGLGKMHQNASKWSCAGRYAILLYTHFHTAPDPDLQNEQPTASHRGNTTITTENPTNGISHYIANSIN